MTESTTLTLFTDMKRHLCAGCEWRSRETAFVCATKKCAEGCVEVVVNEKDLNPQIAHKFKKTFYMLQSCRRLHGGDFETGVSYVLVQPWKYCNVRLATLGKIFESRYTRIYREDTYSVMERTCGLMNTPAKSYSVEFDALRDAVPNLYPRYFSFDQTRALVLISNDESWKRSWNVDDSNVVTDNHSSDLTNRTTEYMAVDEFEDDAYVSTLQGVRKLGFDNGTCAGVVNLKLSKRVSLDPFLGRKLQRLRVRRMKMKKYQKLCKSLIQ